MHAIAIAELDSTTLARRLGELAGEERQVQVAFLLHLDEFDRRRAWAELGFPSVWEYLLRRLHLREGAAGRRIAAMKVLRRHPRLEPALRAGRLCLSTAAALAPVLKDENLSDVVARAAYRTKAEVEQLVAALAPRPAPREGLRKLAARAPLTPATAAVALPTQAPTETTTTTSTPTSTATPTATSTATATANSTATPTASSHPSVPERLILSPLPSPARPAPARLEAIAEDTYSLRVTVDAALKAELDTLRALLGHKVPAGDYAALVREAVRCAVRHHGKRRGALAPERARRSGEATGGATGNGTGTACATATGTATRTRTETETETATGTETGTETGTGTGTGTETQTATETSTETHTQTATQTATETQSESTTRPRAERSADRPAIPRHVRREVWARDGGRCTFVAADGQRCGTRERLELDHVRPYALGGASSTSNLRLRCRAHNLFEAGRIFGAEFMRQFGAQANCGA
jgi:hypothetical protein